MFSQKYIPVMTFIPFSAFMDNKYMHMYKHQVYLFTYSSPSL